MKGKDIFIPWRYRYVPVQAGHMHSDASGCYILLGQEAQNNIHSAGGEIEQERVAVCDGDQTGNIVECDSETRQGPVHQGL